MMFANSLRRFPWKYALLFLGITLFFSYCAHQGSKRLESILPTPLYDLIAHAFALGQLNLPVPVDPRLLALPDPYLPEANRPFSLHDAALFHGKYYAYFGPAPALFPYLPWRVLTGTACPNGVAVVIYCVGAMMALWLAVREWWQSLPDPPNFQRSLLLAGIAAGLNPLFISLLQRPAIYEAAIASAACLVLMGHYFLTRYCLRNDSRLYTLTLASCCYAVAAACRPTALFVLPAFGLGILTMAYRRRDRARLLSAAFLPVIGVLLILVTYNIARFGSPLEFGVSYTLTGHDERSIQRFIPSAIWHNSWLYLFSHPAFVSSFPYLDTNHFTLPPNWVYRPPQLAVDSMIGIGFGAPLILLLPALLASAWQHLSPVRRNLVLMILGSTLGPMLLMFSHFGVNSRYVVDFLPGLVLVSLLLMSVTDPRHILVRRAAAFAILTGAIINVALAFTA